MSNDDVYAAGLLNRALDPATQPPAIRAFLRAELDLLHGLVADGMRVLDVGCGTGRHLLLLRDRLRLGVGVPARREWYRRLGHNVLEDTPELLVTDGGFRSEHFSEARLRDLLGECALRPLAGLAYAVTF